ncbi:glycosyltransferase family 2 protein [Acinetobacter towneri]|uniref:glycosyltransferase family 2 protein n=1 Tax=Acinetobacter towneri TaxID=202956 RepID=UPI001443D950|nr:glycosyltransferase [Acinetobacter towneri]
MNNTLDLIIPVKNGGELLIENLKTWVQQSIPNGWKFSIIVVNDGSTDGIPEKIQNNTDFKKIIIVNNTYSLGRSGARNRGAKASCSEYLFFVDADCVPASQDVVSHYIKEIEMNKSNLIFGSLRTTNNNFWGKYFQEVCENREKMFLAGNLSALTTANFVVQKALLETVGGFDNEYKKYGFEDRDLFIRLNKASAQTAFVPKARVNHEDKTTLQAISRKMLEAGCYSAPIFRKTHLMEYKMMPFYKVDASNLNIILKKILLLLGYSLPILVIWGQVLLVLPIPYSLKKLVVKLITGSSFLIGTTKSQSQ